MSRHKVCRPKVRTTFRKGRLGHGNRRLIFYNDPNLKWRLIRNWEKAQAANNAVMEKKG